MWKEKGSWAKVGIYCCIFCTLAGLAYGLLFSSGCPCTSLGLGAMAFVSVLGWLSVGFLLCAILQKRRIKLACSVFLAANLLSFVTTMLVFRFAGVDFPVKPKSPPVVYPKLGNSGGEF